MRLKTKIARNIELHIISIFPYNLHMYIPKLYMDILCIIFVIIVSI